MKKYQSKNFFKSAMHAADGLYLAFRTQKNFRKHLAIAAFALVIGVYFKLSALEIALLVAVNSFVLLAELVNSVVEFILDAKYGNRYSRLCKFAKDIAAGAVLLSAVSSAAVGAILILPKAFYAS